MLVLKSQMVQNLGYPDKSIRMVFLDLPDFVMYYLFFGVRKKQKTLTLILDSITWL
jgi:hypothetical protein